MRNECVYPECVFVCLCVRENICVGLMKSLNSCTVHVCVCVCAGDATVFWHVCFQRLLQCILYFVF